MKVNTLIVVAMASATLVACGGGGNSDSVDDTSVPDTTATFAWNEIDKAGGGRRWQCYTISTGKPAKNVLCNGLPQTDYYPG